MGCEKLDIPRQKCNKGLWSPYEDQRLKNYILRHGIGCWSSVPFNAGLQRTGKSCRLRWVNYLRPGLKQGPFSIEEEKSILRLHGILGNKWSQIAQHLPGRTDNEIKNYWHCYLKKNRTNMAETETLAKTEYRDPNIGEEAQSDSSPKTSLTSSENIEGSLTDTDQSLGRKEFPRETGIRSLPKVLFSEWLLQDQFCIQVLGNTGNPDITNTLDQDRSDLQDLLLDEGILYENIRRGLNDSYIDLEFEDQKLESGLLGFNQEEINITSNVIYPGDASEAISDKGNFDLHLW